LSGKDDFVYRLLSPRNSVDVQTRLSLRWRKSSTLEPLAALSARDVYFTHRARGLSLAHSAMLFSSPVL
jgi:hypothetical protein